MESRRLGPFELGEKIGTGGMGVVYRATHLPTGKQVAVKLVRADLEDNARIVARFKRELEILKRLRHPHIVRCYGGGVDGTRMFLAMKIVDGGSLAGLVRQRGRLSWEDTIHFGVQICEALEYAHSEGIIHRDLKPSNLLLTRDGRVKLSDFGLARYPGASALTVDGRALGTCYYTAPELIRGSAATYKCDLYSLGCLLYELVTGQKVFKAESLAEMFAMHLEKTPAPVSSIALDCPIWLETLIHRLMAKNPADRPHDAGVVRAQLLEIPKKVAEQQSVIGHSLSGESSAFGMMADGGEVRKALGGGKKKRSARGPVWDQPWFLAACLLLLAALVGWALWPMSESQLYAHAQTLMKSTDPVEWRRAEEEYLRPYLARFPEGPHASDVRTWLDQIEMHMAEQRLRNNQRLGREPSCEAERLFAHAWRYEQFGDRITAVEEYRSMIHLLGDAVDDKTRPFLNLARRQLAALEGQAGTPDDRRRLVEAALAQAEELAAAGDMLAAHTKWQSIITLYGQNKELAPLVERAQARLAGRETPVVETGEAPATPATTPANATAPATAQPPRSADGAAATPTPRAVRRRAS
ncbi:MAG: serine/threonine protein kinase [Pirellulales bacterium]|nr:serine/threonine protein kinase [Pirellulales bacterium]